MNATVITLIVGFCTIFFTLILATAGIIDTIEKSVKKLRLQEKLDTLHNLLSEQKTSPDRVEYTLHPDGTLDPVKVPGNVECSCCKSIINVEEIKTRNVCDYCKDLSEKAASRWRASNPSDS